MGEQIWRNMNTFVLPLDSPEATLASVGGKGVNLSRMARAGFPVPPGFIVTTNAYRAFVQANSLQEAIVRLAKDTARSSDETSAAIRGLFTRSSIPFDVLSLVQSAYAELIQAIGQGSPVAVRSSATAEDLPGASFAGQQESYLNVRGEPALLEAVKCCWSSLWTARAVEYRARQGIEPSRVSLAVVVQQMIPAEVAGILFTANPMSGVRDEIVLDASWGLGEAIVGGLVTPDHIVADKKTGVIKEIVIGEKAVMTTPTNSGTVEREVENSQRHVQVLSPAQVAELVRLGASIEALYGIPQDIEWCWVGNQFFIVQARPITTLPPEPVRWESAEPGALWVKDLRVGEWAKDPPSPLGATTTFEVMAAAREQVSASWPVIIPRLNPPGHTLINGWLYTRRDQRLGTVLAAEVTYTLGTLLGLLDGHRRARQTWSAPLAALDACESVALRALSDGELRLHADQLLQHLGWWWFEVTFFSAALRIGEIFLSMAGVTGVSDPAAAFRGNDSLLLEADRALRRAAIGSDADVDAYLTRFGHFVETADPLHPTLREAPAHLDWQLAAARAGGQSPDERLRRAQAERARVEEAVQDMRGAHGFLARRALAVGQSHAAHLDDTVFHLQRVLAAIRATYLEVARRLVSAGILKQAEDVFYLEQSELWRAVEGTSSGLQAHVEERRAVREGHLRLAPPACIPPTTDPAWSRNLSIRLLPPAQRVGMAGRGLREQGGRRILVGWPDSPGQARGIARVVAGPADFARFRPGDVLVTHATSPIWTPLLSIAAAAVTEVGGPVAHAAIVAREFGIPLVGGALDATRVIMDGAPIVVDGTKGIVEL